MSSQAILRCRFCRGTHCFQREGSLIKHMQKFHSRRLQQAARRGQQAANLTRQDNGRFQALLDAHRAGGFGHDNGIPSTTEISAPKTLVLRTAPPRLALPPTNPLQSSRREEIIPPEPPQQPPSDEEVNPSDEPSGSSSPPSSASSAPSTGYLGPDLVCVVENPRFRPIQIQSIVKEFYRHECKILDLDDGTRIPTEKIDPTVQNIWHPFSTGHEFKLATFFHTDGTSKRMVDWFFQQGVLTAPKIGASTCSSLRQEGINYFTCFETLLKKLDWLEPELPASLWTPKFFKAGRFPGFPRVDYQVRDFETVLRHLLSQTYLAPHFHYLPERWYRAEDPRIRVIGPPWTGDMWYEEQIHVDSIAGEPGHFVIGIVLASDSGLLSKYCGDASMNPLNFSLWNIDPDYRACPSNGCWRSLAMLPEKLKYVSSTENPRKQERFRANEVVQAVIADALKDIPRLHKEGITVLCPDGKWRIGHVQVVGWLADYMEVIKVFSISKNSCPSCQVPTNELDSLPVVQHPQRPTGWLQPVLDNIMENLHKAKLYGRTIPGTNTPNPRHDERKAKEALSNVRNGERICAANNVLPVDNALLKMPRASYDRVWKPDLLHTLDIGMIQHVMDWLVTMVEELKPLNHVFDTLWVELSPHPRLTRKPNKGWREIIQRQGTEYRVAVRLVLAVMEAAVESFRTDKYIAPRSRPRSHEQEALDDERAFELDNELQEALTAISALVDFHTLSYYSFHTVKDELPCFNPSDTTFDAESTLNQMNLALLEFFEHVEVFRGYKVTAAVNRLVRKEQKLRGRRSNPSKKTTAAERRKAIAEKNQRNREIRAEVLADSSSFSFIKMHLMTHFCGATMEFGALKAWSASENERNLQDHKKGYSHSSKKAYQGQVFRYVHHLEMMRVRHRQLVDLLEKNPSLTGEVRADIEDSIGFFTSKLDMQRWADRNRAALKPKETAMKAKKQEALLSKQRREEKERQALLQAQKAALGVSSSAPLNDNALDSSSVASKESSTPPDSLRQDERDIAARIYHHPKAPQQSPTPLAEKLSKRFKGVIKPNPGEPELVSVDLIEQYLKVTDLGGALVEMFIRDRDMLRELGRDDLVDRETIATLNAFPRPSLVLPRPNFNEPDKVDDHYVVHCTPMRSFAGNGPRHDFVAYKDGSRTVMADERVARLEVMFVLEIPTTNSEGQQETVRRQYAAVRPTTFMERSTNQVWRRTFKVCWAPQRLIVIPIQWITRAISVVPILPPHCREEPFRRPTDIYETARGFVVNNRIDDETYNLYY